MLLMVSYRSERVNQVRMYQGAGIKRGMKIEACERRARKINYTRCLHKGARGKKRKELKEEEMEVKEEGDEGERARI